MWKQLVVPLNVIYGNDHQFPLILHGGLFTHTVCAIRNVAKYDKTHLWAHLRFHSRLCDMVQQNFIQNCMCKQTLMLPTTKPVSNRQEPDISFCKLHQMYFFKWAIPGLFFVYFWSFQTSIAIFTTYQCENMSIQYHVLGSKPTSSWTRVVSITTRLGLLPHQINVWQHTNYLPR